MANKAIPAAVKTALAYRPAPPASLTGSERARFEALTSRFNSLCESDLDALAILVRAMERADGYRAKVAEEGLFLSYKTRDGVPIENPYNKLLAREERNIIQILAKFGGTPASRRQNALSDAVSTSTSDDKLREFLS